MAARYELVVVDRQPAQSAPPTFTEVEALVGVTGFSWQRRLSGVGQASVSFPIRNQADDIKARLADLTMPTELWILRDGVLVFAGPIVGLQIQGVTATMTVPELGSYMFRWVIEPWHSLVFTNDDQHMIGKALIDYWQALDYGHFGFDTSGITDSGVNRDRVYAGEESPHVIGTRLSELAAVQNGFEWTVEPDRTVVFGHPQQGSDRSAEVIVDARSVATSTATWSVGKEDFASFAYVWSSAGNDLLTGAAVDSARLVRWGRVAAIGTLNNVTQQATVNDKARALLDSRGASLYIPAPEVLAVGDISVDDVSLGDSITLDLDYGMGKVTDVRRVLGYTVTVDGNGASEKISLELN